MANGFALGAGSFLQGLTGGIQAGQQLQARRQAMILARQQEQRQQELFELQKKKLDLDTQQAGVQAVNTMLERLTKFDELNNNNPALAKAAAPFLFKSLIDSETPEGRAFLKAIQGSDSQGIEYFKSLLGPLAEDPAIRRMLGSPQVQRAFRQNPLETAEKLIELSQQGKKGDSVNILLPNGKQTLGRENEDGTIEILIAGNKYVPAPAGSRKIGLSVQGESILDLGGPSPEETPQTPGAVETLQPGDVTAATGGSGFFGNLANVVSEVVTGEQTARSVGRGKVAVDALTKETTIELAKDVEGKPSNLLLGELRSLSPNPASLLQGDRTASDKAKDMLSRVQRRLADVRRAIRTQGITKSQRGNAILAEPKLAALEKAWQQVVNSLDAKFAPGDTGGELTPEEERERQELLRELGGS